MNRLPRSVGALTLGLALSTAIAAPAVATQRPQHETAAQLLAAAEATTLKARSITLTERLRVGSALDLITIRGRWPERLYVSVSEKSVVEQLVITTNDVYLRLNAAGWEQDYKLKASAAASLAGKWLVTTRSDPALGGSTSVFNPKHVESVLYKELNGATGRLVARSASVAGRPAIALADAGGAIYVAARGKPYVLRITSKLPSVNGFLEFANFNHSTNFALPSTNTQLDVALAAAQAG